VTTRYLAPLTGARPAGIEPRAAGDRRRVEAAIRFAIVGAVAYQVFQRVVNNGYELSVYGRSLWYVSYQFGFVRRGLAGEVLRRALGRTPTVPEVAFAQNVIAVVTVASAAWLVWLLCRRRTAIAYALAALMAVSPFGFDFVGGSRRPDLVAFLLLALVAVWVATGARGARARRPGVGCVARGLVLFSEAGPLVVGAVARARGGRARPQPRAVALGMPLGDGPERGAVGRGARARRSRGARRTGPDRRHGARGTDRRRAAAAPCSRTSTTRSATASARCSTSSRSRRSSSARCSSCCSPCWRVASPRTRERRARWVLATRSERAWWAGGALGAAALLFGLGFDWMRWITSIVFAASLAIAAIVVLVDRGPSRPELDDDWNRSVPSRVSLSLPSVGGLALAVYLLVLPPLPTAVRGLGDAAHLLMNAPG